MKHTTEEMILAALVRELALNIRHGEWLRTDLPVSEKDDWHDSRPLDPYIEEATEELASIAATIKLLTGQDPV